MTIKIKIRLQAYKLCLLCTQNADLGFGLDLEMIDEFNTVPSVRASVSPTQHIFKYDITRLCYINAPSTSKVLESEGVPIYHVVCLDLPNL